MRAIFSTYKTDALPLFQQLMVHVVKLLVSALYHLAICDTFRGAQLGFGTALEALVILEPLNCCRSLTVPGRTCSGVSASWTT